MLDVSKVDLSLAPRLLAAHEEQKETIGDRLQQSCLLTLSASF